MDNDKIQELLMAVQLSLTKNEATLANVEATLKNLETKLNDYEHTKTKVEVITEKLERAEKDITTMQENQKWLWRSFAGAIITSVIAILVKFIKIGG